MVAQTRHSGGPPAKTKLKFREKLTGKGHSSDALLKRLQTLHAELADMDQEQVDVDSLDGVRKDLISNSLMLHKDRGVKAYTAACLADLLRLFAPDAPYTQGQLRDIFQFFFRQLVSGLKTQDSAYYNQYFHLLESLSTVKSVVLVCDLPNADDLMKDIFRDFFALVRREFPRKMEIFMADIMVALLDECQSLPGEVLEILMSQFMDKNAGIDQPAYRLAVQVMNSAADKLQRHVSIYFTDIIVGHSEEEEFDEIRTAHDLIKRLHASCPSLLHSVIPQLEEELHAEEVQIRLIATQVIGEMLSSKGGSDLAKKYPSTWNHWLSRKNDKIVAVRLKFVETSKGLLGTPELGVLIEEALEKKLLDPDDKVRAAVCKLYGQIDYETALHHVSEKQLKTITGRVADRKQNVRLEALTTLARLYSLAYPEIENKEKAAIQHFSWIPKDIFHKLSNIAEVRAPIQHVVAEHLLPLPKPNEVDDAAWTDRLLTMMIHLDEKATTAFYSLTNLQATRPTPFDNFIDACIKNNGGVIDDDEEDVKKRLDVYAKYLSEQCLDPTKAYEDLKKFAELNEGRLYKLFKVCADVETDLKALIKATNDFTRRVEQTLPALLPTMSFLVRRASLRIVNSSSIPTLLARVAKVHGTNMTHTNRIGNAAAAVLTYVSKHCPALYRTHVPILSKAVADEANSKIIEIALQALAAVQRSGGVVGVPSDERTIERMKTYALDFDFRNAKFAARFLAFSKDKDEVCTEVVESIVKRLPEALPDALAAHAAALTQFSRFAPDAFEQESEAILNFFIKDLLVGPDPHYQSEEKDEEALEWDDEEEISDILRAKIWTMKMCRHRALVHHKDTSLTVARPVLRMLATLMDFSGSWTASAHDNPKVMARMRLQAAVSLLHLSTVELYANAMTPRFFRLALMIQDSCYNVRYIFLNKLISLLSAKRLPAKYNVIPFLTVHDPEMEVKGLASSYVMSSFRKMPAVPRMQNLEMIFIRLLHLLAHHPDFRCDAPEAEETLQYIIYYLDLVSTNDNIALLYHLALKGKTVRDAEEDYTEKFYQVCEIAQELIRARTKQKQWQLTTYPGKIKLPSDILRPLPNAETSHEVVKTIYLPEPTREWIESFLNPTKEKKKVAPKRKAASSTTNGHTKRQRTKKRQSEDSDDEPSQSDVDMGDARGQSSPLTSEPGEEEEEGEGGEEQLGRGARSRAKAKAKRLARLKKKEPTKSPTSDD